MIVGSYSMNFLIAFVFQYGDFIGTLTAKDREPRQTRKGAAVAN